MNYEQPFYIDEDDLNRLLESADYLWNDLSNFQFEVENIDLDRKGK